MKSLRKFIKNCKQNDSENSFEDEIQCEWLNKVLQKQKCTPGAFLTNVSLLNKHYINRGTLTKEKYPKTKSTAKVFTAMGP